MKTDSRNINGYIEGYYGRLINWSDRHLILKKLYDCKFNTYFYCPKEDLNHRLDWRSDYTKRWVTSFKRFCAKANELKINVFIGISPGLDFVHNKSQDFDILCSKAKKLKSYGASNIVLMFDDIPPYPTNNNENKITEGALHAKLANSLSETLDEEIYVVPRVYSNELREKGNSYIEDFTNILSKNIPIFYCGKKIVSDTNSQEELFLLEKNTPNRIIFWDNLYANDYCPMKVFLGPYLGRSHFNNTMINPTGMIETDLFLLDLIYLSISNGNTEDAWIKVLEKYKIPYQFNIISEYFFSINYRQNKKIKICKFNEEVKALDFLLWKWKSPLSREWYQYMLILKQNLELFNCNLKYQRIKKIFPVPLKNVLRDHKRSKK